MVLRVILRIQRWRYYFPHSTLRTWRWRYHTAECYSSTGRAEQVPSIWPVWHVPNVYTCITCRTCRKKVHCKSEIKAICWIKIDQLMSLALLCNYLMLNMFRMLVHPSSGACDLFVELFHVLYSGSMCVGVTVWFGWGGVVSGIRLKH